MISKSEKARIEELVKKYDLVFTDGSSRSDDIYIARSKRGDAQYVLVTKSGVRKIQLKEGIKYALDIVGQSLDYCTVDGKFFKKDNDTEEWDFQTYGSASTYTSNNKFFPEMAEKRCISRGILTLIGEDDFFGEEEMLDEIEHPKDVQPKTSATYKR